MSSVSSVPHVTVIGEEPPKEHHALITRLPDEIGQLAAQEILDYTKQIAWALRDPSQCDNKPAKQAEYLLGCLTHADLQRRGWLFIMGYVLTLLQAPEYGPLFQLVGSGYDSMYDLIVSEGLNKQVCDDAKNLWQVWSLYEDYTTIQEVLRLPTSEHLRIAVRLAADLNRQAKQEREHHPPLPVERARQEAMSRVITDLVQTPEYDLRDKRVSLGMPTPAGTMPRTDDENEDDEPLFAPEEEGSAPAPYRPPVLYVEAREHGKRLDLTVSMERDPDQVDRLGTLLWDMGAGFNVKCTWAGEPATLKPHELAERMREAFGYYTPPPLDDGENEGTLD